MGFYGKWETYKVVYNLPPEKQNNFAKGVALVEAGDRSHAISVFQEQYRGQFFTIVSCEKLLGGK
ncbi:MAG: hypothetical protein IIX44_11865 [Clostridia bacterium]|nr:hypothetical protein [Clostridia bacterium]